MQDYKFSNLPKEYESEDYKGVIVNIVKKYSKIKNLLSIYNWGSPSVPGISDLDILMVFDRNASPLPMAKRSFYFLDAKTRYLLSHPFIFIDKESFQNIRYVHPNASFELLHGKNISIKELSKTGAYYSQIALLNDICIRHYPRDFILQSVNKKINVRDTLLRLNSLKYTALMLESLTKTKVEWNSKLKLVDNLRKNWFNHNDFELLVKLNNDAVDISMGVIGQFRDFLMKSKIIKINSGDKVDYNGIKNKTIFIKNWAKKDALQKMIHLIKNNQKFYSILPIEFAAQLIEYSKYKGLIGNYIMKNLNGNLSYQLKYKAIIKKRIQILNNQANLAAKLKHSDFAAFFDFGYRNGHGINNWMISLLDKIRF
ncbi:hypothetical protein HYX02_00915 [Candidatus Woesearchaeota archaeon]|nr:hypothetical protein [Candidatus Woesearchaeota archaeon]